MVARVTDLKIDHDFEHLFPDVVGDEYDNLKESIRKHGVMDSIKTWNGFIVDGHTRIRICKELGIEEVHIVEMDFEKKSEAMSFMLTYQKGRRKMTPEQVVLANDRIKAQLKREAKERQSAAGGDKVSEKARALTANLPEAVAKPQKDSGEVMEQLAKNAGKSRHTYEGMEYVVHNGDKGHIDRLNKGESVSKLVREVQAFKQGENEKQCPKCGKLLPISEISSNGYCKKCDAKTREANRMKQLVKGKDIITDDELYEITRNAVAPEYTIESLKGELISSGNRLVHSFRLSKDIHKDVLRTEDEQATFDEIIETICKKMRELKWKQ